MIAWFSAGILLIVASSMFKCAVTTQLDRTQRRTRTEPALAGLQACPECGGAMRQERLGEITEYICHVGHRLGLKSMIVDKTDLVERAMYMAVAQSEELVALLEVAKENSDAGKIDELEADIASRRQDIEAIRAVLERSKSTAPTS